MIQIDLRKQNILVTGGSSGIGKEIARYLMKMGARVGVHYHQNKTAAQELVEEFPDTGSFILQADFSKPETLESFWQKLLDTFGHIDSIVLNAGVFMRQPVENTIEDWFDSWNKTMKINLDAPGLLTKLAIGHYIKRGGGKLIYIASRAVFRGETEEYLAYAASKGGLVSLARSVARSFGKSNIKSFIIAPGFVKTNMAEQFIADHGAQTILSELSLNELTAPKDLCPLVALMCKGAMDHATGATIDVNAGSHIR